MYELVVHKLTIHNVQALRRDIGLRALTSACG